MILIVGLGNPSQDYKGTRHNVGREIAETAAKSFGLASFRLEKKWNALVAEGKIGRQKTTLLLPETFMNKSGNAIIPAARFYKIKPKDIYVIHDDADLALGKSKLSFGKHSAGHKGVESVIRALKTRDFWRFRIGIAGRKDIPAEKIVLKKLTPDELKLAKKIHKKTVEAIEIVATDGPEKAMNNYNT